jgi:hypothetical protein
MSVLRAGTRFGPVRTLSVRNVTDMDLGPRDGVSDDLPTGFWDSENFDPKSQDSTLEKIFM